MFRVLKVPRVMLAFKDPRVFKEHKVFKVF